MKNDISFRDRPININEKGGRKWVYAKKPSGKLYRLRTLLAWLLLLFFIGAPFLKVNGSPFVLLDIVNRKFIIFGAIFWAQDTFILALLMLSFILFIIVFTVTYGRIWCGWVCPQTIFMEIIFRKIEYLIEGSFQKRRKRDNSTFSFDKFFRKTLKHLIFIIISILITNVFLLWFVGYEKLFEMYTNPIREQLTGFIIILIVSGIFYWIYAFFREQICTMVCPYGRMQGVLLDSRSIVVSYDYKRGEPRGKNNEGDCIDCRQCIQVCPTGIDIKDGVQLECINCTACIDECNSVMKKIGKPKGLIRFDSYNGIENGQKTVWNARNRAYSVVLVILLGFFIYALLTRPIVETTILRTPGTLYQIQDNGKISNLFNIKIINKTHDEKDLNLKLIDQKGEIQLAGKEIKLEDQSLYESVLVLAIDKKDINSEKTDIKIGIFERDNLIETYNITFIGPK